MGDMEYHIIFGITLEYFLTEVQQYVSDGWIPLGPPIIDIAEYTELTEGNIKKSRGSQWYFHQALTRENKPEKRGMF